MSKASYLRIKAESSFAFVLRSLELPLLVFTDVGHFDLVTKCREDFVLSSVDHRIKLSDFSLDFAMRGLELSRFNIRCGI